MRVGALVLLSCYALAMAVSRASHGPRKMKGVGGLLEYRGFLDVRYACLSAGAVVASLGVYVPLST